MKVCECGCGERIVATNRFVHGHHQRLTRPDLSDLDVAWLAGLLEGEGSFIITKRKRTAKRRGDWTQTGGRISVGMIDADVVARVAAMFGSSTPARPEDRGGNKPIYRAYLSGPFALDLMRRLRPHMGTRRQAQIDAVLDAVEPALGKAV